MATDLRVLHSAGSELLRAVVCLIIGRLEVLQLAVQSDNMCQLRKESSFVSPEIHSETNVHACELMMSYLINHAWHCTMLLLM